MVQFQTRSPYSHVAVLLDDKSVIEAWQSGGVLRRATPFSGHSDGTVIDIYGIHGGYDNDSVETFLIGQVGKKYDWTSVMRFVSRRQVQADDKWFCSELVLAAFLRGGLKLLSIQPSLASPRDISISPCLVYEKTISNG